MAAFIAVLLIIALREGDEHASAQALLYQERRDTLVDGLRRIGWVWYHALGSQFIDLRNSQAVRHG